MAEIVSLVTLVASVLTLRNVDMLSSPHGTALVLLENGCPQHEKLS